MKKRDMVRMLEKAGFEKVRDDGDHTVYYKKGFPPISVPRHIEINEITARNILKRAGLKKTRASRFQNTKED